MAVYVFAYEDTTLKVGKAGSNSHARYISQHYNAGSAPSTLAAALLKRGGEIGLTDLRRESVSGWIKTHTYRINFFLDSEALASPSAPCWFIRTGYQRVRHTS
jgi:hypothetical protein